MCALFLIGPGSASAAAPSDGSATGEKAGEKAESEDTRPSKEREVEVVGGRPGLARSAAEPSVAASTIEGQRLEQPGQGLAEALREAPGVQVTQTGGLGSPATVRLRGATAEQTPIYLGDVRINDEVGGVADLSTVPQSLIERIEVYRGHAPRRLMELGLGGAIVLVPKKVDEGRSSVRVEAGDFGTRAISGSFGIEQGERSLLAIVEAQGADNDYSYQDTRGTLFDPTDGGTAQLKNADSTGHAVWLQATDRVGSAFLSAVAHLAEREQGAPRLALVPTESAQAEFSRGLFALTSTVPLKTASLLLSSRAIFGQTLVRDPARELGLPSSETKTPGERLEQVVEFRHHIGRALLLTERLTGSVEHLRRYEEENGGSELALAAKRFVLRPAFLADLEPVRGLHLGGVVTLTCVSTTTTTTSGACERPTGTGRVSARYERSHVELYGSLGRYQRLASLSELYGASVLVRGNPNLTPEIGLSPELGFRTELGKQKGGPRFWTDVSTFARFSSDLITYVRSAQGYLRPVNRDSSRTLGAELVAGVEPLTGLTVEGNISLLDARDTSPERVTANDVLPFVSAFVGHARASYRYDFDPATHLDHTTLAVRVVHQSSRYADPAGLGVIPAQSYGDLEWSISALREMLVLRTRVSNFWNSQRYDIVGFPLPPRSFFMNMEVSF